MQAVTIQKRLVHCGDECVVLATDSMQRLLLGVSQGQSDEDDFVFVRISRTTLLRLERSAAELSAAIARVGAFHSITTRRAKEALGSLR